MSLHKVLHSFSTIGQSDAARSFPGFLAEEKAQLRTIDPRGAARVRLQAGDLLAVQATATTQALCFDDRGNEGLGLLGLAATSAVNPESFQSAPLAAWMASHDGDISAGLQGAALPAQDAPIFLKSSASCDVWLINPARHDELVEAAAPGRITFWHQPKAGSPRALPDPLGDVRDEFTVARGSARAYELRKGEVLQIIDIEGQQCSDFVAFHAGALQAGQECMIDGTATRSLVRRSFPGPGLFDKFYDPAMRPLLRVEQDTCGRHDTFGLACTARSYEERGFPGHLNCSDNISGALERFGVARRNAWPAINFFWNTWVEHTTHHLQTAESHSRPGDFVTMRALEDLVCASTACPDDLDPINGWNPTDIHVRIYKENTPIRRAVAYREKEDAPMQISQESAFHSRTAALTEQFAPARDLWTPLAYPSAGTVGEYWACREKVTLQDMSGLRKFDIIGPDAERLLDEAMTRDMARLAQWRGTYSLMCDEAGEVIDDGTLFRLGPELYRWCCGTEESARTLTQLAEQRGYSVRILAMGGALPNLSLQGPKSRDVLRKILFTQPHVPDLDKLKWFGVTIGRLGDREGAPFMLSRTGYTGELGYEIFCAADDAVRIWDAVMQAGEEFGIEPMGSTALDILRVEAGLAASGHEFAPGADAWEAGLGFAIDLRKDHFTGRSALERNAKAHRKALRGLKLSSDEVPAAGAPVYAGERQIGVVTSAVRSPMLKTAIAMARIGVEYEQTGTALEIGQLDGHMKRLHATVCDIPFIDPERSRARA